MRPSQFVEVYIREAIMARARENIFFKLLHLHFLAPFWSTLARSRQTVGPQMVTSYGTTSTVHTSNTILLYDRVNLWMNVMIVSHFERHDQGTLSVRFYTVELTHPPVLPHDI